MILNTKLTLSKSWWILHFDIMSVYSTRIVVHQNGHNPSVVFLIQKTMNEQQFYISTCLKWSETKGSVRTYLYHYLYKQLPWSGVFNQQTRAICYTVFYLAQGPRSSPSHLKSCYLWRALTTNHRRSFKVNQRVCLSR